MSVEVIIYIAAICGAFLAALICFIFTCIHLFKKSWKKLILSAFASFLLVGLGITLGVIFTSKAVGTVNRVIAEYDYDIDTPDAFGNRKGFERLLKLPCDQRISKVYYSSNSVGVDVQYQLAFKCDQSVIDQIIQLHSLKEFEPVFGAKIDRIVRDDLPWWNENSTEDHKVWSKNNDRGDYFRVLWYSSEHRTAYYNEYSL